MIGQELLQLVTQEFVYDCEAKGRSRFTVEYYRSQLAIFTAFCFRNEVVQVGQINANLIRMYLAGLREKGHNPGGVHAKYRPLRVFFLWYQNEYEPENWSNPILKVRLPAPSDEPIDPAQIDDIQKMIWTCTSSETGLRDKAMLYGLLDTGARLREFLAMDIQDYDNITGGIVIHHGKGDRKRIVFVGRKARRTIRKYLAWRTDDNPALWVSNLGERMAPRSLQSMLLRRAIDAGITDTPSPHDFRRAFTINMLRSRKVTLFEVAMLLGDKTLDVVKRYAKFVHDDLQIAHQLGSPVDNLMK